MDNLLGKVVKQAIGQKGQGQNEPSSNSGLLHKVTDAVTGQKHPGEGQFAPNPYTQGKGSLSLVGVFVLQTYHKY